MAQGCPLCERPAAISSEALQDASSVVCERCGQYVITRHLLVNSENFTAKERELLPYLGIYTRQEWEAGRRASVGAHNWKMLATPRREVPVSSKLSRALEWYGNAAPPGTDVRVMSQFDTIAPLWDAATGKEARYLVASLVEARFLQKTDIDLSSCVVTPAGWARLQADPRHGVPGRCFVAMSFNPTLNDAFAVGIRPAVEDDCQLRAVRVDREEHNEKICDRIVVEIKQAEFVVADVTRQRQGVYFEAGYAMGLGRPVIWTCRDSDKKRIHFDTRQYNHILWETPADLRKRLADRIRATILK